MSDNIQQTIVDLLNQASLYGKDNIRVQHLRHVQELILRKDPNLLEQFLEEVLTFQTDKSVEVKKTIISFIEEACQCNPKIIIKVIDNLHFLLYDDNLFVQKKLILSLISIYKSTLIWLLKFRLIDENIQTMWQSMTNLKNHIISMINTDNDGLCIVVIKFIEMLIIILSEHEQDFSTNFLINDHEILSRIKLEQERNDMIDKLLEFSLSQHLSNVNLIAAIEAITNIARYRSDCISRVIQTFEILQGNLPSTLIDSQVDNVRKIIKLRLFSLLKHSTLFDLQPQMTNLLTNLGAAQAEILKHLPKAFSESKRKLTSNDHNKNTKKSKNINGDINRNLTEKETVLNDVHDSNSLPHLQYQTVADLIEKLSIKNVVDLVLVSMCSLPEKIPDSFQSVYTPITDAGTPTQIEHLARLLSTQLTAAGYKFIKSEQYVKPYTDDAIAQTKSMSRIINIKGDDLLHSTTSDIGSKLIPCIQQRKTKLYKLSNAIKPIEYDEMQRMSLDSFHRILHAEDICDNAGVGHIHKKIMNSLVCLSEQSFSDIYKDYIIADICQRYDLAFAWLYQEYIYANGYLTILELNNKKKFTKYDNILCQLLECLQEKDNNLFSRLFTSVPLITDNALVVLKQYCQDENDFYIGMNILRNLIIHRMPVREKCLDILLHFTHNEKNSIRNNAINIVKNLHNKEEFKQSIERYAVEVLQATEAVFNDEKSSMTILTDVEAEDSIRLRFSLYLSLLPSSHYLIQPLTNIYTTANEDMKSIILQILEIPIREMGMTSPEILKLIKNCPTGAETLITHIIHILIENMSPSYELVETIRDLYYQHISDVRFLIPVLTVLEKREIISALPKLIKLPPSVVKEVLNQLLGLNASTKILHASSISPSELLIALHEISLDECELKIIINATSLCFNERSIYTHNILTDIIQHLVQITPIPILFMRTVLQTLSLYPKMVGFIMNILQQLITKQVWKQARLWEGFIKCCEKTRPHSFPLLLQLPPSQLKQVFQIASELRDSLRHHLHSVSIAERSSIPSSILTVIENN